LSSETIVLDKQRVLQTSEVAYGFVRFQNAPLTRGTKRGWFN